MSIAACRYVKPNLLDTARGTADPHALVRQWLGEAAVLVSSGGNEPQQAHRLLALWQSMARLRPKLLKECDTQGTAATLESWAAAHGASWAGRLPRFDGERWQSRAKLLEDSYEEDWTPEQRTELATALLTELDDAQLAALALYRLGVKETDYNADGEFAEPVEICDAWCLMYADTLLAASTYVQAVGLALRPDLLEHDAALALTAVKFAAILAAAEDAEDEISLRPHPWASEVGQALVAAYLKHVPRPPVTLTPHRGFSRELLPLPVALAAEQAPLPPRVLWWQSPDRRYRACLALPARPADDTVPLVAAFSTADDQPALDLAGQPVRLADAACTIGPDAKARWTLSEVSRSGNDLVLEVGPNRLVWEPSP